MTTYFLIKMVKKPIGNSITFPTNGAGKLDIFLQENEIRFILSTLYKKINSKRINYFNLKPKAMKLL